MAINMSRHRYVRNMRYDDYADNDDYDYDDYSEEETDAVAAQYLWRGEPQQSNAGETDATDMLAQDFSHALSMQDSNDAAVLETSEAERKFENSSTTPEHGNGASRGNCFTSHALSCEKPSAIGALLEDTVAADSGVQLPVNGEQPPTGDGALVSGGRVLLPTDGDVRCFDFEQPSPDDLVMAKRGRGRERMQGAKLRLPKPSQSRLSKPLQRAGIEQTSEPAPTDSSSMPMEPSASGRTMVQQPAKTNGRKGLKLRVPKKSQPRVPKHMQGEKPHEPNQQDKLPHSSSEKKTVVQRLKKLDVTGVAENRSKDKTSLSIVVAGHVDAGKSTLLGQLLSKVGGKASKFATGRKGKEKAVTRDLAWLTDEDALERSRGVTIDICTRLFKTERNGKTTDFAMVDAPGHRDFVPAMIMGAMQASAAVLVVDASRGEFEAGVSDEGQTREHALLLRAMGVTRLVVAVNKLDTIDYDKKRYNEVVNAMKPFLKSTGWRPDTDTKFVPVAGRAGVNVEEKPPESSALRKWYKGPTFLQTLEALADAAEESTRKRIAEAPSKPTRLMVLDSFRSVSLGGVLAVSGRLLAGSVAPRDVLMVGPWGEMATVKSVEVRGERVKAAIAGVDNTPVSIGLQDIPNTLVVAPGNVLCDPASPVPIVTKILAQIVVIASPTPLLPGTAVEIHVGGGSEAAMLHKLVKSCARSKDATKQKRPRRLVKNESAVVEIKIQRAVCLERAADLKALGRFTLRSQGRTVAAGIVLEVLKATNAKNGT